MTDDEHATGHQKLRIEYRTDGNGPWREREFDTVEHAGAWAHQHLGGDLADVGPVQYPEPIEPYLGIGW